MANLPETRLNRAIIRALNTHNRLIKSGRYNVGTMDSAMSELAAAVKSKIETPHDGVLIASPRT